jgi:hypothetical protein
LKKTSRVLSTKNTFQLSATSSEGWALSFMQQGVNGIGIYTHTKATDDGLNAVAYNQAGTYFGYNNLENAIKKPSGDGCFVKQLVCALQILTITEWGKNKGEPVAGFVEGTFYRNLANKCESSIPHKYRIEFRLKRDFP